jgi:hypothetical protein
MKNLLFGLLTILLLGCSDKTKYWDIEKFKIVKSALTDNQEIKLLYSSQAPDNNENLNYYLHLVVVNQKTGDTVNVLTTAENGFTINDADKIFNYFDESNIATKSLQLSSEAIRDLDVEKLKNLQPKQISKVVRNEKYDYIADNNFPTVIGSIGILTAATK